MLGGLARVFTDWILSCTPVRARDLLQVRKNGEVAALPPQPPVHAVDHPLLAPVVVAQGPQLGELPAGAGEAAVQVGGALADGVDDEGEEGQEQDQRRGADHQEPARAAAA